MFDVLLFDDFKLCASRYVYLNSMVIIVYWAY